MMKRTLLGLIPAAMLILTFLALPAAGGENTVSRFCKDNNDFGLSHGGCVSAFNNGNTSAHDAAVCKMPHIREFLQVETVGQCVTKMKELRD